jgi:hypothetical protein
MTDSEAFQIAVEIVAIQARACEPPELSTGELELVVRKSQLAQSWQASTAYPQGAVVLPLTSNGHRYQCAVAGTSGDVEPDWNQFAGTSTTDGTVTWLEAGLARGYFDTDQATFEAWFLKTGKAAALVQQSSAGQAYAMQQLTTHCRQMAADWEPTRVA